MIRIIPFPLHFVPKVRCVFTVRGPGMQGNLSLEVSEEQSAVRARRNFLQKRLNLLLWAELRQVHGTHVVVADEMPLTDEPVQKGDGLFTHLAGLALGVKTADCQPLLLASGCGRFIGALHCGWRGNRAGFPTLAVQRFARQYGLHPADIHVIRGPSLGPGRSEFVNFHQEWGPDFLPYYQEETKTVDLWRMTRDQIIQAKVPAANLQSLDICTYEARDLFFSHRRNPVCGRQMALVWREK